MCFEKDNVKNEENINHIPRLGIGTGAGRKKKKKKKKTALMKLSSVIKYEAMNHRILLKF